MRERIVAFDYLRALAITGILLCHFCHNYNSISFLEPIFKWLKQKYLGTTILLRGDSGFASSEIYDLCYDYDIDILIKLKANAILKKLSNPLLYRRIITSFGIL